MTTVVFSNDVRSTFNRDEFANFIVRPPIFIQAQQIGREFKNKIQKFTLLQNNVEVLIFFQKRNCEISLEVQRKVLEQIRCCKGFVRSPDDDSVGVETCIHVKVVLTFWWTVVFD